MILQRFYELVDWLLMLQSDSLSSLDHETFFQSVLVRMRVCVCHQ